MSAPAGSVFLMETEHAATIVRTYPIYVCVCLLYTSDAADERSSVDLGGRRNIKKKNDKKQEKKKKNIEDTYD